MIIDPIAIQNMVNPATCFHCEKPINNNSENTQYYSITLNRSLLEVASSHKYLNKHSAGTGAILRFHIECYSIIAGEDYMFDRKIWR